MSAILMKLYLSACVRERTSTYVDKRLRLICADTVQAMYNNHKGFSRSKLIVNKTNVR